MMIEVFGTEEHRQMILLHHIGGIGEEEIGISLEMDDAAIHEEVAITVHEISGGKTLARILHLWIAEGKPYLLHLVLDEEAVDDLNVGTQESHVLLSFLNGFLGSCPHTGALDIYSDEIHLGIEFGKFYGIFALTTSQLENDGIVVVEIHLTPFALHLERHVVYHTIRVLEDILECLHVCKLC